MVSLLKKNVTTKASKHFHRPVADCKGNTRAGQLQTWIQEQGYRLQLCPNGMQRQFRLAIVRRDAVFHQPKGLSLTLSCITACWSFISDFGHPFFLNACLRKYPKSLQSLTLGELCVTWRTDTIKHLLLAEFAMLLEKTQINCSGQL